MYYMTRNEIENMLQDRVDRGVALLDETMPDWAKHIDTTILEMGDTDTCILGQLFGWYSNGLAYFSEEYDIRLDGSEHGFDVDDLGEVRMSTAELYRILTAMWDFAIGERVYA